MELSCPNTKMFHIFCDIETLKRFLIFRKMKLSSSNIKKILRFSHKKAFLIFQETNPPPPSNPQKNSLYFNKQKMETETQKNVLYYRRELPGSKNEKKNLKMFLIFLKMERFTF